MLIDQIYNHIKANYYEKIKDLTISQAIIGVFNTAVKLSDGSYGVASTLSNLEMEFDKKHRDYDVFSPGQIEEQKVIDLFETTRKTKITDTLKVSVLNAISSKIIENGNYKIIGNTDPIDLIDLTGNKTVTIVGAFDSYINKVAASNCKLNVLELNFDALRDEHKQYFVAAEKFPEVIPVSDIVIITGLTIVNSTIDGLLAATNPKSQVIITGPSSSMIPDVLFENNVDIIGSIRITKPEMLMKLVSQAAAGFHLFRYCAEKICIVKQ